MQARSRSRIVTLLADFGASEPYAGVMKGVILGINPDARVVDLCLEIPPFDIVAAALMLRDSYSYFPRGTVHVAVVDPGVGGKRRILAVTAGGHRFVAPDNGLLAPVLEEDPCGKVVSVTNRALFLPCLSDTFHGRDIMAPVAAHLAAGKQLMALGPPASDWRRLHLPKALRKGESIIGEVVRIDRFGNLITNIPMEMIPARGGNVFLGKKSLGIIQKSYASAAKGKPLAYIGGGGWLEIACNFANASMILQAGRGAKVRLMARKVT